jgi:N-acetylneuraminic acid mutarotase
LNHVRSIFCRAFSALFSIVLQTLHHFRSTAVLTLLIAAATCPPAHAQSNEWTWMGGNNIFGPSSTAGPGQPGVYGTQGQPSVANVPGGRLGPVSWTDKNGNLWLFGGGGFDSNGTFGFLNDLWKFDPSAGEWTWILGSNTVGAANGGQPGIYGQQGTAAAANTPGGRSGAVGWTDASGNFWLFGGAGFDASDTNGNLNDLWKFSPSSGQWTWVGGSANLDANGTVDGVYGTLGSLTAGSIPGSRNFGSAWVGKDDSLWLFGGYGGSTLSTFGPLNDLWRYVPSTNQWAWMGGSSTTEQPGVYGQLGSPAPANVPGARESEASWVDNNGNFWLFGGAGFVTVGSTVTNAYLNDLWKFDPTANEWTWVSGSNTVPASCQTLICLPGMYGTLGTPAPGNTPGGRASPVTWTDREGALWLFGGTGVDANGEGGTLNDVWKFDPAAGEWTWMGGSNSLGGAGTIPGMYGTLGIAAAGNSPGGRTEATGWTDANGNFWLFGGSGSDAHGIIGDLNDLWVYMPVTPTPTLDPAPGNYTAAQTVTITDSTPGALIYYTTDGTNPTTSSSKYSGPITVSSTQTIMAIAAASGYSKSAVTSGTYTIQSPAATPAFSPAGGTYTTTQMVAISDATPGASIYYTTDGTNPTTSSSKYSGPITVSSTQTIKAIAAASGYSNSAVASGLYTIQPPAATPAFSPAGGTYTTTQIVTMSDATPGASIYYTTDGTNPTPSSSKYTGPITVSSTQTVNAIAAANGYSNSALGSAAYVIQPPPTFAFSGSPGSLTIASGGEGTVTLTVTPQNGFYGAVSFACAGLPSGVGCTFSPTTVTPSGTSAVTTQLTFEATTATGSLRGNPVQFNPAASLALAVGFLWLGKRRRVWLVLLLAASFAGAGILMACGGGSSTQPTTPNAPVTSTVTVNATSGSIQQSATVTLTVN